MDGVSWLPLITGVITGALTGGIALLGLWGAIQHRLGRLEARMDNLERQQEEAKADYIRLHEQARDEYLRLHEEAKAEYLRLHEEARAEYLRLHEEARAENIRQHEETRAEIRREVRFLLQVLREHHHGDGRPAVTPVPVDAD